MSRCNDPDLEYLAHVRELTSQALTPRITVSALLLDALDGRLVGRAAAGSRFDTLTLCIRAVLGLDLSVDRERTIPPITEPEMRELERAEEQRLRAEKKRLAIERKAKSLVLEMALRNGWRVPK